ncbi:MAG: hypothetical protein ACOVNP_06040 [Flavobacterium sp.]
MRQQKFTAPEVKQPKLEQLYAYNERTKQSHFITTGATFNDRHFLTTPVIIGKYDTTDVTLRKKYKKYGKLNKDYFVSDGKVLVSEIFLDKQNIKLIPKDKKVRNSITKEIHVGAKFPYQKAINLTHLKGKQSNLSINNKEMLVSELKNMHWDEFITISTGQYKYMDQNNWDQAILKFSDLLALKTNTVDIRIAYSTEVSIDIRHKRVTKYDCNHRHIHLFLNYGGKPIIPKVLKSTFLLAMDYKNFNRHEYFAIPFVDDIFGENYIMKTHNYEKDCFSMCAPDQNILSRTLV